MAAEDLMRRGARRMLVVAAIVIGRSALAGTLYWDTDGSGSGDNSSTGAGLGGSGNWNSSTANWWNGTGASNVVWSDGSDAIFYGAVGTVTAGTVSANSMTFKTNGDVVKSGQVTVGTVSVDAGITATISSTIAGTATMIKSGAGILALTNSNINTATSSAGGWRIDGGTLRLTSDTNLGISPGSGVTDLQINQSIIQAANDFTLDVSRRTKINTNSSTQNLGDAVIDVNEHTISWFGSLQGGFGTLRATSGTGNGGMLILGTDKIANINPFGSALPAGTVNLTVENRAVVQTSGTVTPTGGELGSETGAGGAVLAILLQTGGQIRSESGGYNVTRNLILGPGGGTLDTGAWEQTFSGSIISGTGSLGKFGTGKLILDNPTASWAGGTSIHSGTLQLGVGGSNGLLPGTLANPGSVVIDSGANLRFVRGSNKTFFDAISGGGGVVIAGTATVRFVSNMSYTGGTTISSGTLMIGQGNAGEPGAIVGNVVDNATLNFNRVEDITFGGAISGTGAVTKQAAGKLYLTGTNSYSGATTVSKGGLLVTGSLGNTAINVSGGCLIGGTGTIGGSITLTGGADSTTRGAIDLTDGVTAALTMMDANSAHTVLTIGGSAGNASLLNFDVGATSDRIVLNAGKMLINAGGGIINVNALSGFGPGVYDLILFGNGQATGLGNFSLSSNVVGGYAVSLQSTTTSEQLKVSVVPEPGMVGVVLLGILGLRRRRISGLRRSV